MRTSETDPIRVDFLPSSAVALAGRIGITFAPGKKDAGARWNRDLAADLDRLRSHYGAHLLVSLIEDHELTLLGMESLVTGADSIGLRLHRYPIRDVDIPRSTTEAIAVVRLMLEEARAGRTAVVHCRGGIGRAGTIAACCLVALGHPPAEALRLVRSVRPGALETRAQESYLDTFAEAWSASSDGVAKG